MGVLATAPQALYLFAPLLVSAALSALVLRFDLFRVLKRPIDGGRSWRGTRLFGDNKTWRGVFVAVVGSIATVFVQSWIGASAGAAAVLRYDRLSPVVLGLAMGGGAMLGELPNSFVKRRLGVAPGAAAGGAWRAVFYVWDQVDLLTTTWPLLLFWLRPRPALVLASFIVALGLHPLVTLIGFALGARRTAR